MCCCCLKEQSKRHLSTIIWRATTVYKRDKKTLIFGLFYPIMFIGIFLGLSTAILKVTESKDDPLDFTVVTASAYDGPTVNWVDTDSGYSTTQDFKQCLLQRAQTIGLVDDKSLGTEATAALQSIFTEINTAFSAYYEQGANLNSNPFDNYDKVQDYVESQDYATQKLCFTIGWSEYVNTADERSFELDIRGQYNFLNMTDANNPQNRYFDKKYDLASVQSYNATDFLQVMALATKVVVGNVDDRGTDLDSFSVMYAPMETEAIKDYGIDGLSLTVAIAFEIIAMCAGQVMGALSEPREDMIQLIMKRLGVQKSVIVTRDLTIGLVYVSFYSLICMLLFWLMAYKDGLGLGALFVITMLYVLQINLRQTIMNNVLPSTILFGFNAILLITQVSISNSIISSVPSSSLTIFGCCVSPMIQLLVVLKMGYTQLNFGFAVGFGNMSYEVFPGLNLNVIVGIAIAMSVAWTVALIYLWPLVIESDPENPLAWYYPFTGSFWRGKNGQEAALEGPDSNLTGSGSGNPFLDSQTLPTITDVSDIPDLEIQDAEREFVRRGQMEVPKLLNANTGKLVVSGLNKRYGSKQVVNDLSMTFFQNEILVLLGHNGAGKTTTLNMLTGLVEPTSGTAVASGIQNLPDVNLFTDYQNIADFIGLCPQVDVLFTKLTVRENLIFYCKLKGIQEDMDRVVDDSLEKFNLSERQAAYPAQISGGQKRKLQLAIALLGNSKIVLLDEPTSGMDPTARRETWEIIKEAKKDRIVILTTHYMDEAEYLADRVAVISKGSLRICGTTNFLKKTFGQYYYLEVEPVEGSKNVENAQLRAVLDEANNKYRGHVPDAPLTSRSLMSEVEDEGTAASQVQETQGTAKRGLVRTTTPTKQSIEALAKPLQIEEELKNEPVQRESQTLTTEYQPINMEVDEAGKLVYKLPNYLSCNFGDIFAPIDADPAAHGIKAYKIKNMTLEQVFIAIGQQEITEEEKKLSSEDQQNALNQSQAVPADDANVLEPVTALSRLHAMLVASSQVVFNNGIITILVGITIIILINFLVIYVPYLVRSEDTLTYTDVSSLFLEDSIPLKYNSAYLDSSSNAIISRLLTSEPTFKGEPQESWSSIPAGDTYQEFLEQVSSDIGADEDQYGAYWVSADQDGTSGAWDINAVIFANSSSPATAPAYGNALLQSIAQTITADDKLSLKFSYRAFDINVAQVSQQEINPNFSLVSFSSLTQFALETVVLAGFIAQLSGGYFTMLLMRGATRSSILLPRLVIDFVVNYVYFQILWLIAIIIGVQTSGWQLLGLVWAMSTTLYQNWFLALLMSRPGLIVLRVILLAIQMLLLSFVGSFFAEYSTSIAGYNTACFLVKYIPIMPSVQFCIGLFMIQFRYTAYVLANESVSADPSNLLEGVEVGPFSEYGGLYARNVLLIQCLVYAILLALTLLVCKPSVKAEASDIVPEIDMYQTPAEVATETQRVARMVQEASNSDSDILLVDRLVKRYYTPAQPNAEGNERPTLNENDQEAANNGDQPQAEGFNAVKGTSFGVKRGEVFSLLGVNGAGKSSTFNCLVGFSRVSGGQVLIDGIDVNSYVGKPELMHGLVGYCPQTNNFSQVMTVKQQITLMARLVGATRNLDNFVTSTITRFGLTMFTDTQARNLSGGNMRKLCLALAMLGRPKIIYIDEASAGVDPASRRVMWKAIRHTGQDSAVVLTTHAMEEAEAISSKIAIQVSGWFRSFGTLAQVQRVGQAGYFVECRIDLDDLRSNITSLGASAFTADQSEVLNALTLWERDMGAVSDRQLKYKDEFKDFGLLDKYYRKVHAGKAIDMSSMLTDLLMQDVIAAIGQSFNQRGMSTSVLNLDGTFVVLNVTNCDMTFGQIYAFLEGISARHNIHDYSCKMTSLEEVFNQHATESAFTELNKRIELRRNSTFRSVQD